MSSSAILRAASGREKLAVAFFILIRSASSPTIFSISAERMCGVKLCSSIKIPAPVLTYERAFCVWSRLTDSGMGMTIAGKPQLAISVSAVEPARVITKVAAPAAIDKAEAFKNAKGLYRLACEDFSSTTSARPDVASRIFTPVWCRAKYQLWRRLSSALLVSHRVLKSLAHLRRVLRTPSRRLILHVRRPLVWGFPSGQFYLWGSTFRLQGKRWQFAERTLQPKGLPCLVQRRTHE